MKNNKKNFLDYIPCRDPDLKWSEKDGIVTVDMEHKGFFDHIAQTFFHRPGVSHIDLDRYGSFVWMKTDGVRTAGEIAELLRSEFGEEIEPLYQRFVQYMKILKNNKFIDYIK